LFAASENGACTIVLGDDPDAWPNRLLFSGGKLISFKPRKTKNRAAAIFRLAAQGAMQSKTTIGAFSRRIKARLGAPTAINAGAHKLARSFYRLLKFGSPMSSRPNLL
jgi:hypothetical protein